MSNEVEKLQEELVQADKDFERVADIAERHLLSALAFRAFLGKKGLTEEYKQYEKYFKRNFQAFLDGEIEI